MKRNMTLLVYDSEMKEFVNHQVVENSAELQDARIAFKQGNIPWKMVALMDKNGNAILSFYFDSVKYELQRLQARNFIIKKYVIYLARNKTKIGTFSIQDKESYNNLVLKLLQNIETYLGEKNSLGKKKAKKSFKCAINQLVREAKKQCIQYVSEESFMEQINLCSQKFVRTEWSDNIEEMQAEFVDACHTLYKESVRNFLQAQKRDSAKSDFKAALSEIKEKIVQKRLPKSITTLSENEEILVKEEYFSYLNEKNLEDYWLWQSFIMSREKYPKARKNLDDIISEEEIYEQVKKGHSSMIVLDVKYFSHVCKMTQEEALEFRNMFTKETHEGEIMLDEKLKELVSKRVYEGYHNLVKRYAFIREYHEIIFGTYKKYINSI